MDKKITAIFISILLICLILLIVAVFYYYIRMNQKNNVYRDQVKTAIEKCKEYMKQSCVFSNSLAAKSATTAIPIIQGSDVVPGQLPHMAYVSIKASVNSLTKWSCGGSLISENFVLSAAHCLNHAGNKPIIKVKLGSTTKNLNDQQGKVFDVEKFFQHPEFVMGNRTHDIVLLKLTAEVEFSWLIRPMCLNTEYNPSNYDNITTSGWGLTEEQKTSENLKMVQLYINGQEVERKCGRIQNKLYNPNLEICAGYPKGSKSPHRGDSGGPLQIPTGDKCQYHVHFFEIIGVTSGVQDRELQLDRLLLSLYTKVAPYIPWIVDNVWPD